MKQILIKILYRILFILQPIKKKIPEVIEYNNIKLDISKDFFNENERQQFANAYEEAEISLIEKYFNNNNGVIELGSGIGYLAIYLQKNKKINNYIGIEANPNLIKIIEKNKTLNACEFQIYNYAFKEMKSESHDDIIEFNINSNFYSSSIVERELTSAKIHIKAIGLDKIIQLASFIPDTLIMDIEGGELEMDFEKVAQNFDNLLLELHPHIIGADKVASIITAIIKAGYNLLDFKAFTFYFIKG